MNESPMWREHAIGAMAAPNTRIAAAGASAWLAAAPDSRGVAGDLGAVAGLLPVPVGALAPELTSPKPMKKAEPGAQEDDPLVVAGSALTSWNDFLRAGDHSQRAAFARHAEWLIAHEIALPAESGGEESGGWPTRMPLGGYAAGTPYLSASVQSAALSTLLRAYQLTSDARYAMAARRAALTLHRDILDGGVLTPIGREHIWFEDLAVYPAAHGLEGFLRAWLALFDYAAFTEEPAALALLERAHASFHALARYYDAGSTTRAELLHGRAADVAAHQRHTANLETLVQFTGCQQCAAVARRWRRYARNPITRARTRIRSAGAGRHIARPSATTGIQRVCVPITAYPVAGGMRAVMGGWRQAMAADWQMEFFTRRIGPEPGNQIIRSFELQRTPVGREITSPAQFPNVWLYTAVGGRKLRRLLRENSDYACVLPQDGLFTAAFSTAAARRAGMRVVSVDHGNVQDIYDPVWYQDRIALLKGSRQPKRLLSRMRLSLYRPSLRWLARRAAKRTDHFLAASEDIIADYHQHLGVPPYRTTWFPFMIDAERYHRPAPAERARLRAEHQIPEDSIVILLANRLHPMKGMDTAIPALRQAVDLLPPDLRARARVIIAGDGPLRAQVEADIQQTGMRDICRLWGEASADEIALLLGLSDIFLFAAKRSINSMAVLEAMAAGCAVVGTTTTQHIADYLADGRGIAVPVGDVDRMAAALAEFARDQPRRDDCGERARRYVQAHHTGHVVRRCLLRVTGWAPDLSRGQPRSQVAR